MKRNAALNRTSSMVLLLVSALFGVAASASGGPIVRLIGATGARRSDMLLADETLFEVNEVTGAAHALFGIASVLGGEAIAFNPTDGLLYHASGRAANSDNSTRPGYVDRQFFESVDVSSGQRTTLFDAAGDKKPGWVIPEERRVQGPNEYQELRGLAWSSEQGRFFAVDVDGLFTLQSDPLNGYQATYLGTPSEVPQAIAFFHQGQAFELLGGDGQPGPNGTIDLWRLDPHTGSEIGEPTPLRFDDVGVGHEAFGILALSQHPSTGALFAILEGLDDGGDFVDRQLVTIDRFSGDVDVIADLTAHLDSLAFVVTDTIGPRVGDANFDGRVDLADFGILKSGFGGGGQADFDSNGKVDLADFGILKSTFGTASNSQPGDVNGDGRVDLSDFGVLKASFGSGTTLGQGDANRDGKVDLSDFGVLKNNFGKSGATSVPEPPAFELGIVGLILAALALRRVDRTAN